MNTDTYQNALESTKDSIEDVNNAIGFSLGSLTLEKLITSAITLVICILVIWIVMRIARRISAHSRLSESLSRFILKVLKIALEFMAILIVADSLGFNVTALLAVFSLLGLALSLSVQNCLSNAMSGITILLTRPFEDGDFIEAGDVSGTVRDIGLIYTQLCTLDNKDIYVPNSDLSASKIINYNREPQRRVDLTFGADYTCRPEQVKAALHNAVSLVPGILCWIALTNPTATEIFEISEQFGIEVDDLRAPLDEEERSRIEVEDNYTLILADVPTIEERNEKDWYVTIPLGIIVTQKMIFTICLEDTQVLTRFMEGRVRNFFTYMKTRFILQILYRNASMYLRYLRIIDKKSEQIEEKLHLSTRNQELMELLELEKSLVYFTTSLKSNEMVLEKLLKVESIKKYPEDTELLEDVIVENKQAIEMANIYSGILSSMMGTFASVISNNLNIVMKALALITIVMSIPTIVFSAYGMNVSAAGMPLSKTPWGFLLIIILSVVVSIIAGAFLSKKKFF